MKSQRVKWLCTSYSKFVTSTIHHNMTKIITVSFNFRNWSYVINAVTVKVTRGEPKELLEHIPDPAINTTLRPLYLYSGRWLYWCVRVTVHIVTDLIYCTMSGDSWQKQWGLWMHATLYGTMPAIRLSVCTIAKHILYRLREALSVPAG